MRKQILFTATIDEHILAFHLPYLKWFKENGFEVHVAAKGECEIPFCDVKYNISFARSPFSFRNFKAYQELKKIIKQNNYSIIHCFTPVGGVVTRVAAISERRPGLKIIYTPQGFEIFKGAPLKNWLLYYPVEKILSFFTDVIITINTEVK